MKLSRLFGALILGSMFVGLWVLITIILGVWWGFPLVMLGCAVLFGLFWLGMYLLSK